MSTKPQNKQLTSYLILRHLLLNHVSTEITLDTLMGNLNKHNKREKTPYAQTVLKVIEDSYGKKKNIKHTYDSLFTLVSGYLEQDNEAFISECIPSMQNEVITNVRRFLYTRGIGAIYRAHSKTRCPMGQMFRKMFPAHNIRLSQKYIMIGTGEEKKYDISDEMQEYVRKFDSTFAEFKVIPRNEAIEFINGLIKDMYYGEDYRGADVTE